MRREDRLLAFGRQMLEIAGMLEASTIVKRSARQVACEFNEEVVLLHLDNARYFGLRDVGAAIWSSLGEPRSIAGICDDILAQFDVDPTACRADVIKFLTSLQDVGLIEIFD